MPKAFISGTGSYLPERVVTNAEVCLRAPTTDAWIRDRLGVEERRVAAPHEQTSTLGARAIANALEMAGLAANQLDGIICSVGIGDVPVPATACYIQEILGIRNQGFAFDIKMACAGGVGGISVARGLVESGMARRIAVVGSQLMSRTILDWTCRTTAPIFGDGAGAVIVDAVPETSTEPASRRPSGILVSKLRTEGELTHIVGQYVGGTREWLTPEAVRDGRVRLEMDGKAVWDCAARVLPAVVREVLEEGRVTIDDVDFVVSHQANKRLLGHVLELCGVPASKSYTNIEKYGNTSAASVLIALDEVWRQGRIQRGDLVLLMAIGAGMTWGAHLLRW